MHTPLSPPAQKLQIYAQSCSPAPCWNFNTFPRNVDARVIAICSVVVEFPRARAIAHLSVWVDVLRFPWRGGRLGSFNFDFRKLKWPESFYC